MMAIFTHEIIFIPLFAAVIFFVVYLNSERAIEFLHKRSLGSREEIMRLMDAMFLEADKKRITLILLLSSFGVGAIVFMAFWPNLVPGIIFGAAFTAVGWSAPKALVKALWERRCNRLIDQMVDGLTIMANGVRAGLSVPQSMERVVENMGGPIAQEFGLVLNKVRLGMSVEEAFNEMAERIPRPDLQMFVSAVNILRETGGNLAETFSTIVITIRERQKIEKKIKAMTAQATTQAIIITLVPFILMVVFLIIDPGYVAPLFTRPLGWFALVLMLSMQVIGGLMMKKVATIKV